MTRKYSLFKKNHNNFLIKIFESFLGNTSLLVFSMLFSLVCTRLYGPEIFGQYTYTITIITLLMVLSKAGLDNGLLYYMPKVGNKFISLCVLVNFLLSLILVVISQFFINDSFIKLMLPLVWLLSLEQVFFGIYRFSGEIKEYFLIKGLLSNILQICTIIFLYIFIGKDIINIAISVYISSLISILIYYYQNRFRFNKIIIDIKFLKYSIPFVLTASLSVIISKIDIIMLGIMTSKADVGVYQVTVQIANLISVLLMIYNTVFAPQISKYYHNGNMEELRLLYTRSTKLLGIASLLFLLILVFLGKFILLIFGQELVIGYISLVLRGIGQFINTAVGSVWLMLAMTGKPKLQVYGNLAACLINIVLNYILIPIYGIEGAAFASMVSIGCTNILGYLLVRREFKVKVYKFI